MANTARGKGSHGLIGLLVTLAAALLGSAYFAHLLATPSPRDGVRLVPFVWLLGALVGLVFALRTLAHWPWGRHEAVSLALGAAGALLALPNLALAATFAVAALLGD